jgi:hypothetical protein
MKSWLLAIAALLGLGAGEACAWYVVIYVDLNKEDKGAVARGGGTRGGAAGMRPGGFSGMRPGGAGGGADGMRPGGAGGGAAGMRPGGAGGLSGFSGMGGMQPGAGGYSGYAGFSGGRPGGAGGYSGFSGMGGFGGEAGQGYGGGRGGIQLPDLRPKVIARAIVEVPSIEKIAIPISRGKYDYAYPITHKWGRSTLIGSQMISFTLRRIDPIAKQYKIHKKQAYHKKGGQLDKDQLLALAEWALHHGLVAEVPKIMEDAAGVDPQDPNVAAFKEISKAIAQKPSQDEPSSAWVKDYLKYSGTSSDHYTLLTKSEDRKEVSRRLNLLEDTYKGFFYWWALHGKVLQVPRYRLVAVLLTERTDYRNKRKVFKPTDLVADGFTARRDNVAVFTARPLNSVYVQLEKLNEKNLAPEEFPRYLKGSKKSLPRTREEANNQVLALVQESMLLEAERAATTHEAVIQLLAAAALPRDEGSEGRIPLLARNLEGPEWIRFGLASVFETPLGAYWPGVGAPNWKYLFEYKFACDEKTVTNKNIKEVLKKAITDGYFHQATTSGNRASLEKAHFTAWALTYYLATTETDKLLDYLRRLSKLPRDMKFDQELLETTFAKAFLSAPSQMGPFGLGWMVHTKQLSVDVPGLYEDAKKERAEQLAAQKKWLDALERALTGNRSGPGPGFPGGPGGMRPPGGPGGMRPPGGPGRGGAGRPGGGGGGGGGGGQGPP